MDLRFVFCGRRKKEKRETNEDKAGEGEPEVLVGDDFKTTGLELDELDDTSDNQVNDDEAESTVCVCFFRQVRHKKEKRKGLLFDGCGKKEGKDTNVMMRIHPTSRPPPPPEQAYLERILLKKEEEKKKEKKRDQKIEERKEMMMMMMVWVRWLH